MELVQRYLWLSQISLFGFLFACTLIIPSVTERNGGVSNFGDHVSTIVPYVLSFVLCSLFLFLSAGNLSRLSPSLRVAASLLVLIGIFDLAILVSTFPRKLSWTYSEIHDYLGIALYVYEFGLSVWMIARLRDLTSGLLLLVQMLGSLLGLFSILKFIHLLYFGQIIGAIGFGLLLATGFPKMIDVERSTMRGELAR